MNRPFLLGAVALSAALLAACATAPATGPMGFFVTSTGNGKGADFGGLAGADQHCTALATAAGAGKRNWRAYLSTQGKDNAPVVNARDRIGKGPWFNAKGVLVARDVEHLHGDNNLTKQTALTEKGEVVNGAGDTPNRHDILTGSRPDGTAYSQFDPDLTCGNWTRGGAEGVAMVGHHDRRGLNPLAWSLSWNSSHQTRGGCSPTALKGTGGDGLLYCFAAD